MCLRCKLPYQVALPFILHRIAFTGLTCVVREQLSNCIFSILTIVRVILIKAWWVVGEKATLFRDGDTLCLLVRLEGSSHGEIVAIQLATHRSRDARALLPGHTSMDR